MLFNVLRDGFSAQTIIALFAAVFVVFCTMPVHEYAHALVATKLGDPTPRLSGRFTLNPMAHIDWIGALMILLVGFGYAKPVSVNPRNFKNPKAGMAITAVAGPISNLLMAAVFILLKNVVSLFALQNLIAFAFYYFFMFAAIINIGLAVFNLIPIPPLDGSRILQLLIPSKYYFKYMRYERYIMGAVLLLVFFGLLDRPLSFCVSAVWGLMDLTTGFVDAAFGMI